MNCTVKALFSIKLSFVSCLKCPKMSFTSYLKIENFYSAQISHISEILSRVTCIKKSTLFCKLKLPKIPNECSTKSSYSKYTLSQCWQHQFFSCPVLEWWDFALNFSTWLALRYITLRSRYWLRKTCTKQDILMVYSHLRLPWPLWLIHIHGDFSQGQGPLAKMGTIAI